MTNVLNLSPEQVARAERLRETLTKYDYEVRSGARKRPRALKVGFELSDRCEVRGIEGRLVGVSVTGAYFTVRDKATKAVVEIPNADVIHVDVLI